MTISTKQHNAIALITFCALLVFFRLNSAAFQPAESLIIFKADLLVQFNGWLDLAPYSAPNGSFILPPMSIWLTAVIMKYVGNLPLHVRLLSAIFSAVSLVSIYQIARRVVGYQVALLAPVLLASTLLWNDFARQVSPEIPAVMFTLVGFWSLIMLHEREDMREKIGFALLYSLGIAGAFLSNFVAGGLTLMLVIPFLFSGKRSVGWMSMGIVVGLVPVVAWYSHVFSTVTSLGSPYSLSGIMSALGALLMNQPFAILGLIAPILMLKVPKSTTSKKSSAPETALLVWFFGVVICSGWSNYSTLLLLTPAAIILALRSFELLASPQKARLAWIMVLSLVVAVFISMSVSGAEFMRMVFTGGENALTVILFAGIALVFLAFGLLIPKTRMYLLTSRLMRWSGVVIPILLILRILVANITKHSSIEHEETLRIPTEQHEEMNYQTSRAARA